MLRTKSRWNQLRLLTWYSFFYAKIGHNRNILKIFESDIFRSVSDIFFFRVVYGAVFEIWRLKKNITIKKKYHFSLFLLKKLQFRIIWEREKKWKKAKNATISAAEWKLKCNFQKHTGRDDNVHHPRKRHFWQKLFILRHPKSWNKNITLKSHLKLFWKNPS